MGGSNKQGIKLAAKRWNGHAAKVALNLGEHFTTWQEMFVFFRATPYEDRMSIQDFAEITGLSTNTITSHIRNHGLSTTDLFHPKRYPEVICETLIKGIPCGEKFQSKSVKMLRCPKCQARYLQKLAYKRDRYCKKTEPHEECGILASDWTFEDHSVPWIVPMGSRNFMKSGLVV